MSHEISLTLKKSHAERPSTSFIEEAKKLASKHPIYTETASAKALRFGREMRLKRESCPLCRYVQSELDKGNEIPIEEWIYLAHLENTHSATP